jgi:hypothetical protein
MGQNIAEMAKKQPCYSLLIEIAPSAGAYCCLSQAHGVYTNKKNMCKKVWKVFETAFSPFLCHTATEIYILCSPSPFISRLILPTPCATNWKHIKNKNIKMKAQGITVSDILFYFIFIITRLSAKGKHEIISENPMFPVFSGQILHRRHQIYSTSVPISYYNFKIFIGASKAWRRSSFSC